MARELLMTQNSFAWTDAEGRLITVDKALRCNARSLLVEGKTFNNIYKMENVKFTGVGEGGSQELKSDGYVYLNKIAGNYCDIAQDLTLSIKPNTIYTLVADIRTNTLSDKMDLNVDHMNKNWFLERITLPAGTAGRQIYKLTSKSDLPMNGGARPLRTQIPPVAEGIFEYKVILFEGDYTNDYIPSDVDGIESVAEREVENGVYPLQITQSHNETDGIVLPNGVTNTIENSVHIQRVGKIVLDETLDYKTGGWENQVETIGFEVEITTGAPYYFLKPVISSCFKYERNFELDIENIQHVGLANGGREFIRFRILRSKLETQDVAGVKLWLKDNPITVYYEITDPITEPLSLTEINMPIPLRSLPNGVCDEVVGNKLIQKIYKYIINNNTKGYIENETTDFLRIHYSNVLPYDRRSVIPERNGISNIMYQANHSNTFEHIYATDRSVWIFLPKSKLSSNTMDGVKSYLSNNPITVYYQLATPIEHTINIPPISISKGSNIITTTNNIKPNLYIKYKRKK